MTDKPDSASEERQKEKEEKGDTHVDSQRPPAQQATGGINELALKFTPKRACEGAVTFCVFDDRDRQCPHGQCAAVVHFARVPTLEETTEAFKRHCALGSKSPLAGEAQGSHEVPTPDAENKRTPPDSSSASPSLESLRQQWEGRLHGCAGQPIVDIDAHANRCAWCQAVLMFIRSLQPVLDHERSLVAEIQRLKEEIDRLTLDLDCSVPAEEFAAEIQRLTDALTQIYGIGLDVDMGRVWRLDAIRRIRSIVSDALPETPHEKGPEPQPDNDLLVTLDCGCQRTRGWRCPIHDQP